MSSWANNAVSSNRRMEAKLEHLDVNTPSALTLAATWSSRLAARPGTSTGALPAISRSDNTNQPRMLSQTGAEEGDRGLTT